MKLLPLRSINISAVDVFLIIIPKSQGSPNLILEVRGSANLEKNLRFVQVPKNLRKTDSASNCVGAGKMIMEKFQKIYWTPCAAHCLDLLLHDLAKFPWINDAVRKGKHISHFILNHHLTLSLYRRQATKELLRPCDTRFATHILHHS